MDTPFLVGEIGVSTRCYEYDETRVDLDAAQESERASARRRERLVCASGTPHTGGGRQTTGGGDGERDSRLGSGGVTLFGEGVEWKRGRGAWRKGHVSSWERRRGQGGNGYGDRDRAGEGHVSDGGREGRRLTGSEGGEGIRRGRRGGWMDGRWP